MGIKRFNQQQKLAILRSAAQMGIKEAAKVAEDHYTSVYEWKRQLEALGEEGFLAYQSSIPGRGIEEITPKKEEGIRSTAPIVMLATREVQHLCPAAEICMRKSIHRYPERF